MIEPELRDLVESVKFTGGLALWCPSLRLARDGLANPTVALSVSVPDRAPSKPDDICAACRGVLPGAPRSMLDSRYTLDRQALEAMSKRHVLHQIRGHVRDLVLHEVDEGLLVAGERPFDPHREGRS